MNIEYQETNKKKQQNTHFCTCRFVFFFLIFVSKPIYYTYTCISSISLVLTDDFFFSFSFTIIEKSKKNQTLCVYSCLCLFCLAEKKEETHQEIFFHFFLLFLKMYYLSTCNFPEYPYVVFFPSLFFSYCYSTMFSRHFFAPNRYT